jgi:hypothetical protein
MSFHIPPWAARPAAVLSILAALAGSVLVFVAAATGGYWWAIWGGVAFAAAALLWYAGDLAAAPDGPGPS